ncbi:MAG: 2-oxoacid:ferredoxin oxidoreductase subunit beta [Candidatus Thiodiazotropha sp. (ex Lucinoma aequizonata)]|nr:2-oxoacid:ferredoxin oxidoreductase subunit beta [Candidatus Thiodiazotropha sp. (ex Lucinoma aequizonata)]MCU7887743.1 2-oxoacid:ferredoxin oxidoreductase subunit beta [Candidatus Thiodiazotropha sp. (ex Lucinoma aequizonata)]MCU7898213.1 2-oxoacid:ferredoxin oxidoreductase subunit beta [Candidatus Thiodiazotropha sp. (ex Lucinoma aequizonata)]MCU7908095.1 2-oxoacid:ferredoxin oxidoreductase subunit beta [Candidatus Thiodiazotropha sp. (ex Lucinoma aequizonata)]MCU7911620.1 2-oxoacid:ferred
MTSVMQPVYLEEKLEDIRDSGRLNYRSKSLPTWCPGCGYFAIVEAMTEAMNRLGILTEETVVVSGIGCASRFPFFLDTYGFHTLHGRVLPVATGVKIANEALNVIGVGGDGDGFAIGGGHIPHAARRNVDITYVLFDNGIYGLTKGQTSPTSVTGFETGTSPYQNQDKPLNPLLMLLSYGASWVGQAYAGNPHHLAGMLEQAIAHRGFSYLHVLSPCVTFDKTSKTYRNLGMAIRDLPDQHDKSDLIAAMVEARQQETLALGLYYKEERPTLGDGIKTIIERSRNNE